MKSKWVIIAILGLLLTQMGSASVTDPNMIIEVIRSGSTQAVAPAVVNGGLQQGALIFADRTTVWGNVGRFAGLDYIKMTMEDRADADVQFAVAIRKAGTIYLVIDNRVGDNVNTNPPTLTSLMTWVTAMGFTPTSYTIGFSEPATVYELAVTGDPNVITLYEQNDGTSRAMYSVIAVPAGWNFPPVITGVPTSTQVAPGADLVVDATVSDADGPSAVTVQWTTVSKPEGATVTYSPNATTEDVTISFSKMGPYTLKIAAFDGEKTTEQTVQVSVQIPTFALQATDHCEIANDSNQGPAGTRKTTISNVKNYNDGSAQRRRICYYRYDLSSFAAQKAEGKVFSNSFFSVQIDKGNDYATKNTYVYAINEGLDGFTLNGTSWNTAPGVDNTPVPALNSPITIDTLDTADISGLLAAFPVPNIDVWLSTGVFPALDAALNADTDGSIVLMYITYDPETVGYEYLSPSHTRAAETETNLKGIILRGQIWYPTYATDPNPAVNSSANPSTLTQLSWTNPAPSEEGATVTSNVYFGTTEPNVTDPDYGLATLATGTANEYVTLPYALTRNVTYYWVVDTVDSASGLEKGFAWTFNTNNNAPVVNTGDNQYLWLDPTSATADLNGAVTDDGFPEPYTVKWEQVDGPVIVATEPNDVEDITVVLPSTGLYTFKLTADDGDLTGEDSMTVFVGATPCYAAKAKPGYAQIYSDYNNDCFVDLSDLGEFVAEWLLCNDSMDAACQ
jgi:hypothetical protein